MLGLGAKEVGREMSSRGMTDTRISAKELASRATRNASKSSSIINLLGRSQQMVDIVTIFKDDERIAADLGKLDIEISWEIKFAANDALEIFERVFYNGNMPD